MNFYTRYNEDRHRNDIEIDFLLSNESRTKMKVFPIEVKSSKNYTTSSLDVFEQIYSKRIDHSYIIHPKSYQLEGNVEKIPPYMLPCIL